MRYDDLTFVAIVLASGSAALTLFILLCNVVINFLRIQTKPGAEGKRDYAFETAH